MNAGKKKSQLAPLSPPRSKIVTVIVYSRPSGYWYAQAHDAATGAQVTDATGYSREGVLRELRGKFAMLGVTIKSITDEDPDVARHSRHHATKKKSGAQLDREIDAFLQSRKDAPNMPHAIPDRGYMVARHGGGTYLSSFGSKDEAIRFARGLAKQTRETYDLVKVQNRGEDRFIVDEIAPPGRAHSTKKPHITSPEGRLADLQRQGFMKRGPMRTCDRCGRSSKR